MKKSNNLAFIIATKDRKQDLYSLLTNIEKQSHLPDQIIIVDSSIEPLKAIEKKFNSLKIDYITYYPPSAAGQRNAGLELIENDIDLVGFVDDDIIFAMNAIENMLKFWKTESEDIGGASFNILNQGTADFDKLKLSDFTTKIGLYDRKIGNVAKSGWHNRIMAVESTTQVEWLPTTAVIWRKNIFKEFKFDPYFDGYSYLEDLDFSYSVGKKHNMVIYANAGYYHYQSPRGRIDLFKFGEKEVQNRLYFVQKHSLSLSRCFMALTIRFIMTLLLGIIKLDKQFMFRACGNISGLYKSLINRQKIIKQY